MTTAGDAPAWPAQAVKQLCASDDRFQRVPADADFAHQVLDQLVEDCELILFAASKGLWRKAHTLSYDCARKSMEQLLLADGWRVMGGGGGHNAVAEVVDAWLGEQPAPAPRIAHKYRTAIKVRHAEEYPHRRDPQRSDAELREYTLDNLRLMNIARAALGKDQRPDVVPTQDNIAAFQRSESSG